MTDLLPLPALPSKRPANPGAKKFFDEQAKKK